MTGGAECGAKGRSRFAFAIAGKDHQDATNLRGCSNTRIYLFF
jgi:hypothetical protein